MKKYICLLIIPLVLFGCGKEESNEVKLCNKLDPYIEKYNNKEISYENIRNELGNLYDEYCNEENNTCINIKSIITVTKTNSELKDCSKITDESGKKLCEASNNLIKRSNEIQSDVQKANIFQLERSCKIAREDK